MKLTETQLSIYFSIAFFGAMFLDYAFSFGSIGYTTMIGATIFASLVIITAIQQ